MPSNFTLLARDRLSCQISGILVYGGPDETHRHQVLSAAYPWMGKLVELLKYVASLEFRYVWSDDVARYVTIYFYVVISESYFL